MTSTPTWCNACLGDGPLRPWPLPNEWGDRDEPVCVRCWLAKVRGTIVVDRRGRVAYLFTTHPQHGEVLRGTIRRRGIEPLELRPVIRWQVADYDHNDLGVHVGDYVDAERILLDATTNLDQIDTSDDTT